MDTLGTTTQDTTTVIVDTVALDAGGDVVNGPEDLLDWDAIDWRDQEAQVQRLRQRIFTATQAEQMPARPCGLLEPCAATSGTHGSEGGAAQ